jgi:hypothetical protein
MGTKTPLTEKLDPPFPILTSYERQVERLQETGFLQFEFPDDRNEF